MATCNPTYHKIHRGERLTRFASYSSCCLGGLIICSYAHFIFYGIFKE